MTDEPTPYFKVETVLKYAQTAYEAYCEFTGWKSIVTGQDLPEWEKLPQTIKDAWCASAHAILRRRALNESRGW